MDRPAVLALTMQKFAADFFTGIQYFRNADLARKIAHF
jgi:hypothetical protein